MKVVVESFESERKHYLVAHHEEGQGYDRTSTSTVIGHFTSRKQALEARTALFWFGDYRFNAGRHMEQRLAEQEGRGR